MKARWPLILLCSVLSVHAGCADPERTDRAGDDGASEDPEELELDEDAILDRGRDFENTLVQLSDGPEFEETHADAAAVVVWGSEDVLELFESIDPDDPTQSIQFPPGTMFVKQHLDEDGGTRGLTMMYRGEPGYYEDGGDWFWARLDDDVPTDVGRVEWCAGCHAAAYNTNFVVGFGKSP